MAPQIKNAANWTQGERTQGHHIIGALWQSKATQELSLNGEEHRAVGRVGEAAKRRIPGAEIRAAVPRQPLGFIHAVS